MNLSIELQCTICRLQSITRSLLFLRRSLRKPRSSSTRRNSIMRRSSPQQRLSAIDHTRFISKISSPPDLFPKNANLPSIAFNLLNQGRKSSPSKAACRSQKNVAAARRVLRNIFFSQRFSCSNNYQHYLLRIPNSSSNWRDLLMRMVLSL